MIVTLFIVLHKVYILVIHYNLDIYVQYIV